MPIFKPTLPTDQESLEASRCFKAMIIGKPGVGKTQILTTLPIVWKRKSTGAVLPEHTGSGEVPTGMYRVGQLPVGIPIEDLTWESDFYPLGLIDVDRKALAMPFLMPYREARLIDVYEMQKPLVEVMDRRTRSYSKAISAAIPGGFLEIVDMCNFVSGDVREKPPQVYRTIALDTLSRMVEHLQRVAEKIQNIPDMEGWHWRKYGGLIEEFMNGLVTRSRIHVIVNCHISEKQVIKDGVERTVWKIAIGGEKRDSLVGYFNEAYFMRTTKGAQEGSLNYRMTAKSLDQFPCRTSIAGLKDPMPADLRYPIGLWQEQMKAKWGSAWKPSTGSGNSDTPNSD